jgi:hypothetical protein
VSAAYNVLFERQNRLVTDIDPFTSILQAQQPYHDGLIVATKEWGQHFRLEGGAMIRRLFSSGDEGTFNREFERYHATLSVHDLPLKGLSMAVSGYHYNGVSRASDITTAGAEVTYDWDKTQRTTAGTDYQLYKFDTLTGTEREDARVYYLKHRWMPYRFARFEAGYELERSLSATFQTITVTMRLDF